MILRKLRKQFSIFLGIALMVQCFVFAVPGYAAETDVGLAAITDDAVIDSSKPTMNIDSTTNGTTPGLFSLSASNTTKKYAYFKFNLSGVSDPSYKYIFNVGAKMGSSNTNVEVSVLGVEDTTWSEKLMIWNTAPVNNPSNASLIGKFTVNTLNGSTPGVYPIDVTDYVRSHLSAGSVTFMVGDTAAKSISFNLYSKEAAGSNPKPTLAVKRIVDPTTDTTPPAWPADSSLSTPNIGVDFITLKWPQATDENGVRDYLVYQNDALLATVSNGTSYNATGLTEATAYSFKVEAGDIAGNYSSNGPGFTKSTLSEPIQPLDIEAVIASSNDGNVEISTLDNNLFTRWSASGDGQWIMFDLAAVRRIGYLGVAFYKGDARLTTFDIQTSDDAVNWTTKFAGTSTAKTTAMQAFDIADTDARYVRLVGHGNSDGSVFFSLTEVHVYSPFATGDTPVAIIPNFVPGPPQGTVPFTQPGMTNPDGSPHPIHSPNPVTGQTLSVLNYGADPADNGIDDTAAIRAAIAAANPGDEVFLPNGTYNLISSPDGLINLSLKTGVNLRGESQTDTVLKTSLNKIRNSTALKSVAQHDLAISNMTLTSAWNGSYTTDHRTNNPDGGGPDSQIIIANSGEKPSHNVTIEFVTVEKYARMGIRADNSHDVVVRGNIFRNATDVGPGGAGYGVSFQGMPKIDRLGFDNDTRWNLAENNSFVGPYLRHGALIQNVAHNNVIRNNTFRQTKLDAIDLHGELEYFNDIYGNTISDILTGGAVGLGNTGGTAPSNHSASGAKNYIHDNHILNSREGINISMGTPDTIIERNLIENTVIAGGTGINVLNAPGTIIRGNTIRNNTGADYWGILLEHDPGDRNAGNIGEGEPHSVQILDNIITGNTGGIQVQAGAFIVLRGNTVHNNNTNYNKSETAHIAEGWPSDNNELSGLSLTSADGSPLPGLTPEFAAALTQYELTVRGASGQVKVVPTAADTKSTVQVNGASVASGTASNPIVLHPGANPVQIVVTSEAGTTKTYEINVKLDVPPTATVSYSSTAMTNQNVIATITPSEPVTVTNNAGSSSHTFTDNGTFTFEFVDAGGNTGTAAATVANIDKEAPVLKVSANNVPVSHTPGKVTLYPSDSVTLSVYAADNGSGVSELTVLLDGAAAGNPLNIAPLKWGHGTHIMKAAATDKAGNQSEFTVAVEVIMDVDHLDELIRAGADAGNIKNKGTENSLLQKVGKIQNEKPEKRREELLDLAEKVRDHSGKQIEQAFADLLLNEISFITPSR